MLSKLSFFQLFSLKIIISIDSYTKIHFSRFLLFQYLFTEKVAQLRTSTVMVISKELIAER